MKLTVYVHDLFYEIGHSNVTLNSLEYIQGIESSDIKFVVYSSEVKEKLFKKKIATQFHFVPFSRIKPVFFKIIWFQLYCFYYSLFKDNGRTKISVGMANLNSDISVLHFIHSQWSQKYFRLIKPKGISFIYKKIFFLYLDFCEYIVFKYKKPKVITVSQFMNDFITKTYQYDGSDIQTIHSGFDLARFGHSNLQQEESLAKLQIFHPELKSLNLEKPTSIFIGAFERKGLPKVLKEWQEKKPDSNLIVIGQSEGLTSFSFQQNVIHIPFTKEINLFYEISDYLLFPTVYEPFGMVIIEALIKGLHVCTTKENVGASEIITSMEGVSLYENYDIFSIPKKFEKLGNKEREERINQRKKYFSQYNWNIISKKYKTLLNQWEK